MLEIQYTCKSLSAQCAFSIIACIYSLLIILSALNCMYQIYKFLNKFSFEIIPLTTTFLQSLLQFILSLFLSDIRILLSCIYVQSITFSIIAMSLSILYYRITINQEQENKKTQKIIKIIFYLFLVVIFILWFTFIFTL